MECDIYSFGQPLSEVAATAKAAEAAGFSGIWFTETKHNPYLGCAVAASVTEEITLGTAIAVAFPRSPMVTAQIAWDLAEASRGRFVLGLGTQVKAHIERRFSTPFDQPVKRLREYVLALRAIFEAFQTQGPLKFEGDHYSFSLLPEFFSPGPIGHPDVPIYVAGVTERTAHMVGEVCDGFHVHPVHSPGYLRDVVRPAIAAGAVTTGRSIDDVTLATPVFMIIGDSDEGRAKQREGVRDQIAFYGSTPPYRPVFEHHGWGDTADELRRRMSNGQAKTLSELITDEMMQAFSVTSTWDDLASTLLARYDGIVDRVYPYTGHAGWFDGAEELERWGEVARAVRAAHQARTATG